MNNKKGRLIELAFFMNLKPVCFIVRRLQHYWLFVPVADSSDGPKYAEDNLNMLVGVPIVLSTISE